MPWIVQPLSNDSALCSAAKLYRKRYWMMCFVCFSIHSFRFFFFFCATLTQISVEQRRMWSKTCTHTMKINFIFVFVQLCHTRFNFCFRLAFGALGHLCFYFCVDVFDDFTGTTGCVCAVTECDFAWIPRSTFDTYVSVRLFASFYWCDKRARTQRDF